MGLTRPGLLSVLVALAASLVSTADSRPFPCTPAEWKMSNGTLKCGTFGGKPNAIELVDSGDWTHAYQELAVVPDAVYEIYGDFYTLAAGECDGSANVTWCSPSVVVCPGTYKGERNPLCGQRGV